MVTEGICQTRIRKESILDRGFANRKKYVEGLCFFKLKNLSVLLNVVYKVSGR